jgi:hypothetical protein
MLSSRASGLYPAERLDAIQQNVWMLWREEPLRETPKPPLGLNPESVGECPQGLAGAHGVGKFWRKKQ